MTARSRRRSSAALKAMQDRPRRHGPLTESRGHAPVSPGDDVAGGEHAWARSSERAIDDYGAPSVEIDLAPERRRAGVARDLHHETTGCHPTMFAAGCV